MSNNPKTDYLGDIGEYRYGYQDVEYPYSRPTRVERRVVVRFHK